MGNSLRCEACAPPAPNRSVFTFSEDLLMKITDNKQPPRPLTKAEITAFKNKTDEERFKELRSLDDRHTEAFGLSPSKIELMLQQIEQLVDDLAIPPDPCSSDIVAKCYEYNKDNSTKCADQVSQYEECVDETVRERIKEVLDTDKKATEDELLEASCPDEKYSKFDYSH